ncbi:MAG: esterase [Lentisphaerae bacterium]|nr:esterase [Lentisphaerota bacterium]
MKNKILLTFSLYLLSGAVGLAQFPGQFPGQSPAQSGDAKPSSLNLPGQRYPQVDSQRRAIFQLRAPEATTVKIHLVDDEYDMVKGDNGVWSYTSEPMDLGFHYYWYVIDGASVTDPASKTFYGNSRLSGGIEVPSPEEDFYHFKDVPHGVVSERWYLSKSANAGRRVFVYTPPDYDTNTTARYPVLYLRHGGGEDETGWSVQGYMSFIMDNLIAEKKAVPMIIVMDSGAAGGMGMGMGGGSNTMVTELIPMIDSTYRTIADRDHRGMAGLSLGGTQTFQTTQANLDQFAWIAAFSSPFQFPDVKTGYNGLMADPEAFAKQVKLFYLSMGENEVRWGGTRPYHEELEKAGIKHVYYESPGTSHEWQTWRRSLYDLAPRLFRFETEE